MRSEVRARAAPSVHFQGELHCTILFTHAPLPIYTYWHSDTPPDLGPHPESAMQLRAARTARCAPHARPRHANQHAPTNLGLDPARALAPPEPDVARHHNKRRRRPHRPVGCLVHVGLDHDAHRRDVDFDPERQVVRVVESNDRAHDRDAHAARARWNKPNDALDDVDDQADGEGPGSILLSDRAGHNDAPVRERRLQKPTLHPAADVLADAHEHLVVADDAGREPRCDDVCGIALLANGAVEDRRSVPGPRGVHEVARRARPQLQPSARATGGNGGGGAGGGAGGSGGGRCGGGEAHRRRVGRRYGIAVGRRCGRRGRRGHRGGRRVGRARWSLGNVGRHGHKDGTPLSKTKIKCFFRKKKTKLHISPFFIAASIPLDMTNKLSNTTRRKPAMIPSVRKKKKQRRASVKMTRRPGTVDSSPRKNHARLLSEASNLMHGNALDRKVGKAVLQLLALNKAMKHTS